MLHLRLFRFIFLSVLLALDVLHNPLVSLSDLNSALFLLLSLRQLLLLSLFIKSSLVLWGHYDDLLLEFTRFSGRLRGERPVSLELRQFG